MLPDRTQAVGHTWAVVVDIRCDSPLRASWRNDYEVHAVAEALVAVVLDLTEADRG